MPPRILIADPLPPAGLEILREGGADIVVRDTISASDLIEAIPAFEALVVRSRTKVTRAVLEAGRALRVVGRCGVGLDNIDVAAAAERRIAVVAAAGASAVSVAELTLGLMISIARRIPAADASMRAGRWERSAFQGTELAGKTLGVIGLGNIGRQVARRALAFDMRVVFRDPHLLERAERPPGVIGAPLMRVIEEADILTIHVPLTAETRGMIGAPEIARMKRGAALINASRGGIVDERALLAAIREGRLAGAALDVFEVEPPVESELIEETRVILTPHIGASTWEGQERAGVEVARRVVEALASHAAS